MKAVHTKEFYLKHWDHFIKRIPGDNYLNLEQELNRTMAAFKDAGLPEEALEVITGMEAKKIADHAFKVVRRMMNTINEVNNGTSSFGYTTEQQEIAARAEYVKRFEFNCLQLSMFCEKYGVERSV